MKLVIDIPEKVVKQARSYGDFTYDYGVIAAQAIINGIELPKGHGRLIDVDGLRCENADFDTYNDYCTMFDEIYNAPIIIEAYKEGEQG